MGEAGQKAELPQDMKLEMIDNLKSNGMFLSLLQFR